VYIRSLYSLVRQVRVRRGEARGRHLKLHVFEKTRRGGTARECPKTLVGRRVRVSSGFNREVDRTDLYRFGYSNFL